MKKSIIVLLVTIFAIIVASPAHSNIKKTPAMSDDLILNEIRDMMLDEMLGEVMSERDELIGQVIFYDIIDKRIPVMFYKIEVVAFNQKKNFPNIFSCPAMWEDIEESVDISEVETIARMKSIMQVFIDEIICSEDPDFPYFIIRKVKESN